MGGNFLWCECAHLNINLDAPLWAVAQCDARVNGYEWDAVVRLANIYKRREVRDVAGGRIHAFPLRDVIFCIFEGGEFLEALIPTLVLEAGTPEVGGGTCAVQTVYTAHGRRMMSSHSWTLGWWVIHGVGRVA
jgi:hypothetical protein